MRCIVYRLVLLLFGLLCLTGCWDQEVLQDISYISTIGIDYENNQFVIYVQMVDFSTVGKTEGGSKGDSPNIWVGESKGSTFALALNNLYNSTQQRIHFGQISSVVFSQKALQKNLNQTMDTFERFSETRLTSWVYATSEPMEDLFSITPMFPTSPLMTKLNSPESSYRLHSIVRPVKLVEFATQSSEPISTFILPTLSIDKKNWKKDMEKMPQMNVNGATFLHWKQEPHWISKDDLFGLRWLEEQTVITPLTLYDNKRNIKSVLLCEYPNVTVTEELRKKGNPLYNLHIKVHATVIQLNVDMAIKELKAEAEAKIEDEIRSTFTAGLKSNVDVYHLEEKLFRKHYTDWKKLTRRKTFPLTSKSLENIKVEIEIKDSGKAKLAL